MNAVSPALRWLNRLKNDVVQEKCHFLRYIIFKALLMVFIIGYFTVGEHVRFLFTSCVKQTNERSE